MAWWEHIDWSDPINRSCSLNRGLVGWWMGTPTCYGGSRMTDLLGRNHGTLTGGPTWVGSQCGPALNFDGINDYVLIPDFAEARFTTTFAISLSVKSASTSQVQKFLLSRNTSSGTIQTSIIYEYVDNVVEFYAATYTGTDPRTGSGLTVADTDWHLITYSYDGSRWRGAIDGRIVFDVARSFAVSGSTLTGWFIGAANSTVNFFNGQIQTVLLHNRGLNTTDMVALGDQWRRGFPDQLNWLRKRPMVSVADAGGGGATPWLYARQPSRIIGGGIGL